MEQQPEASVDAAASQDPEPNDTASALDLAWMSPSHRSVPAQALLRIKQICELMPDLFSTALAVQITHLSISRDILATAIKQFRSDAEALTREDLAGLLTAAVNGGRHGFDAVLRSRKGNDRKGGGASLWAKHNE